MSADIGWSLDQLMELAGLSVAQAIHREYPATKFSKILVLCGRILSDSYDVADVTNL